jgi:hypothetical protein
MPARKRKFSDNNHREHRSRDGREKGHKYKRFAKLRRMWLLRKLYGRDGREKGERNYEKMRPSGAGYAGPREQETE